MIAPRTFLQCFSKIGKGVISTRDIKVEGIIAIKEDSSVTETCDPKNEPWFLLKVPLDNHTNFAFIRWKDRLLVATNGEEYYILKNTWGGIKIDEEASIETQFTINEQRNFQLVIQKYCL